MVASAAPWRKKSLAQNIGQPSLIALAYTIERDRKAYYDQLEIHQKTLDVTDWLIWFAEIILKAQQVTLTRGRVLHRQGKVLRPIP